MDFERAAKVCGSRFVYYKGLGLRLERAVYNSSLDEHQKEGYEEIICPYLVNNDLMFGTGVFSKFTELTYTMSNDGEPLTMICTAEGSLVYYYRGDIMELL